MYKEGRQYVLDAKAEVEGVVKDLKGIQADAKGIWGFLTGLFGGKKTPIQQKSVEKPIKKVKQKAPEFDENQIYAQVADALTKFFHAYNGLKNYIKEQEETATKVGDEEGQDIAIKLVIADLQMEKLNDELREYMVYHVPSEFKDLYSRVNKMIGHIANQQQLARKEELDRKKALAWQRKQVINRIQNRMLIGGVTIIVILWTWMMIIAMIPSSSS
tara:strand:+ start:8964 stop:9611 length:648 start_codon:yes stop_codon:yes gene_type:complete